MGQADGKLWPKVQEFVVAQWLLLSFCLAITVALAWPVPGQKVASVHVAGDVPLIQTINIMIGEECEGGSGPSVRSGGSRALPGARSLPLAARLASPGHGAVLHAALKSRALARCAALRVQSSSSAGWSSRRTTCAQQRATSWAWPGASCRCWGSRPCWALPCARSPWTPKTLQQVTGGGAASHRAALGAPAVASWSQPPKRGGGGGDAASSSAGGLLGPADSAMLQG